MCRQPAGCTQFLNCCTAALLILNPCEYSIDMWPRLSEDSFLKEKKEQEERKSSKQHIKIHPVRQTFWDGKKNDSINKYNDSQSLTYRWFVFKKFICRPIVKNTFLHGNNVILISCILRLGCTIYLFMNFSDVYNIQVILNPSLTSTSAVSLIQSLIHSLSPLLST